MLLGFFSIIELNSQLNSSYPPTLNKDSLIGHVVLTVCDIKQREKNIQQLSCCRRHRRLRAR